MAEAAEIAGAARCAFEATPAYISERVQFARSIASFQSIKHRMAEHYVRLVASESMVAGVAASLDDGLPDAEAEAESWAALALAAETLEAVA